MQKKLLAVIAGPTAAGKTALAIELAKHFRTEIISSDSRQFYREINIGTAKPTESELQQVPHHFINNKSISELYGAGDYAEDALKKIEQLFAEHNVIFLTGGSGLYINAVLYGVDEFPEIPPSVRERLNEEFRQKGLAWLQERVKQLDPEFYSEADLNNPQRLIRALEVSEHLGKPFSSFRTKKKALRPFDTVKIMVSPDRGDLYKRINDRVDNMINAGLVDEVKNLYAYRHFNALKTVGYKEIFSFLDGKYDLETAITKIKQHTRNYAKRQLTWFRNQDIYHEFLPSQKSEIIALIENKLRGDQ